MYNIFNQNYSYFNEHHYPSITLNDQSHHRTIPQSKFANLFPVPLHSGS